MSLWLVLRVARAAETWVLALQDDGRSVDSAESLGGNGRAVCSDCGTDGHEEATNDCQRLYDTTWRGAYPKVAADPIMYCPNVRSIPFGPGPKRTMLVKPGKSEWVFRRADYAHRI